MESPGKVNDRQKAAISTHVTAKKLINILSEGEAKLGDEIRREYETGTTDFAQLATRFSGELNRVLEIDNLGENTYRSILHRVVSGYNGGRSGDAYSGLFSREEYAKIKQKRVEVMQKRGKETRAETKGTLLWTPEMENMLILLNGLTQPYQPGKLQKMATIMETIFRTKFTTQVLAQRISYIAKKQKSRES